MKAFVFIEVKEGAIVSGSLEAITAAKTLGQITAVVAGYPELAAKAAVYAPVISVKADGTNPDEIVAALAAVANEKGAEAFFFGHQSFVQLLTVAGSNNIGSRISEKLLYRLGQIANRRCIRLLNKQISRIRMHEREANKLHSFIQIH